MYVCVCINTHTHTIITTYTRVTTRTVNQYFKQITAIRRAINNNYLDKSEFAVVSPFVQFMSVPVVPVRVLGTIIIYQRIKLI